MRRAEKRRGGYLELERQSGFSLMGGGQTEEGTREGSFRKDMFMKGKGKKTLQMKTVPKL